jgi:hypothetical protein
MPDPSTQDAQSRQDALLHAAMQQPGVGEMLDAYNEIESTYLGAAAATAVAPVVITTNSAR